MQTAAAAQTFIRINLTLCKYTQTHEHTWTHNPSPAGMVKCTHSSIPDITTELLTNPRILQQAAPRPDLTSLPCTHTPTHTTVFVLYWTRTPEIPETRNSSERTNGPWPVGDEKNLQMCSTFPHEGIKTARLESADIWMKTCLSANMKRVDSLSDWDSTFPSHTIRYASWYMVHESKH